MPTDGYSISLRKIGPLLEDMRNLLGWVGQEVPFSHELREANSNPKALIKGSVQINDILFNL